MYEKLMDEVVNDENRVRALEAVTGNRGSAGIDGMKTTELENHLQAHWERIRAKLLAGTYVPSPVRRVEIPKPNGGKRTLGIPTVQDRLIQDRRIGVAPESVERFKAKVREMWRGNQSRSSEELRDRWACYARGWWGYFRLAVGDHLKA